VVRCLLVVLGVLNKIPTSKVGSGLSPKMLDSMDLILSELVLGAAPLLSPARALPKRFLGTLDALTRASCEKQKPVASIAGAAKNFIVRIRRWIKAMIAISRQIAYNIMCRCSFSSKLEKIYKLCSFVQSTQPFAIKHL